MSQEADTHCPQDLGRLAPEPWPPELACHCMSQPLGSAPGAQASWTRPPSPTQALQASKPSSAPFTPLVPQLPESPPGFTVLLAPARLPQRGGQPP